MSSNNNNGISPIEINDENNDIENHIDLLASPVLTKNLVLKTSKSFSFKDTPNSSVDNKTPHSHTIDDLVNNINPNNNNNTNDNGDDTNNKKNDNDIIIDENGNSRRRLSILKNSSRYLDLEYDNPNERRIRFADDDGGQLTSTTYVKNLHYSKNHEDVSDTHEGATCCHIS